jgi:hypothetical protein
MLNLAASLFGRLLSELERHDCAAGPNAVFGVDVLLRFHD